MHLETLKTKIVTEPALEPVTLAEMEMHLRVESNDTASALTQTQSIAPGTHVIAAAFSLEGAGVDVLNSGTVFYLSSGTNGVNGTVDVKIEESDDDVAYTDFTGGAFTQVTTANDNATYEKAYTGIKQYVRAVATVALASCEFGVNIVTTAPQSVEDDYISALIATSRRIIEFHSGRKFITQTWERAMDRFPIGDSIEIPYPPLQTITSIKYFDVDDTEATFASSNYYVDTYSEPGVVALNDSKTWPSTTLRPTNGVITKYICGYGDAAANVPDMYKQAIKVLGAELYEHREAGVVGAIYTPLPWSVRAIIGYERIIPI